MLQLLQSPSWFMGVNAAIDVFSALVLLLIASASYRYYRLFPLERHYADLTIAYVTLAVAFVLKIYGQYLTHVPVSTMGGLLVLVEELHERALALHLLFVASLFFFLLGLYLLFAIIHEQRYYSHVLIVFLLMAVAYMSTTHYFIYEGIVLLFFMLLAATYFERYRENGNRSIAYLALSFTLLTGSALLFIVAGFYGIFYVVAEVIQLTGFVFLLYTFISVFTHGKKPLKTRNHP